MGLHFLQLEWQLAFIELALYNFACTLMNLGKPGSMTLPTQGELRVSELLMVDS